jgi:hypothetical protein
MTEVSKDFEIPEGLSKLGRNAAETIVKTARHRMGADASGGGCRAFYTPEEWKERGESYGLTAKLIVVHDGGDLMPFFNLDYDYMSGFVFTEAMNDALRKIGCYYETCTCWYSAVYEI